MARKSLVQRVEVEQAMKAHNCQANQKHRLQKGDTRLKVFKDRSADHYCRACALHIVQHDITRLQELARRLETNDVNISTSTEPD